MKRFWLERTEDVSGTSGTGRVAEGWDAVDQIGQGSKKSMVTRGVEGKFTS